jgi:hypothetical protein
MNPLRLLPRKTPGSSALLLPQYFSVNSVYSVGQKPRQKRPTEYTEHTEFFNKSAGGTTGGPSQEKRSCIGIRFFELAA